MTRREPTITVYCGPMMASKTTHLLIDAERARFRRDEVVIVKPKIDTRYAADSVITHMGIAISARAVENADELREITKNATFVAIDEAFMIKGVADVVMHNFMRGCSAAVSTLDMSASCVPFEETMKLLGIATSVVKLHAACAHCGANARFTNAKSGAQPTERDVKIGGSEAYEPVCYRHHPLLNIK